MKRCLNQQFSKHSITKFSSGRINLFIFLSVSNATNHVEILLISPQFMSQIGSFQINKMHFEGGRHWFIKFCKKIAGLPHIETRNTYFSLNVWKSDRRIAHKENYFNTESHKGLKNALIILLWRMQSQIILNGQLKHRLDKSFSDFLRLFVEIILSSLHKLFYILYYSDLKLPVGNRTLTDHFSKLSLLFSDVVIHFHPSCDWSLAN